MWRDAPSYHASVLCWCVITLFMPTTEVMEIDLDPFQTRSLGVSSIDELTSGLEPRQLRPSSARRLEDICREKRSLFVSVVTGRVQIGRNCNDWFIISSPSRRNSEWGQPGDGNPLFLARRCWKRSGWNCTTDSECIEMVMERIRPDYELGLLKRTHNGEPKLAAMRFDF